MAETRGSRDLFLLVRLAELLDVPCDRATALRHLEASRFEHPVDTGEGEPAFALAARRAGMRVAPFNEKLEDALGRATPQTPIAARMRGTQHSRWAVVLDSRGLQVQALLNPEEQPRWMSRGELADYLGLADVDHESIDWLMVHASSPCQPAVVPQGSSSIPPFQRLTAILRPDRSDLWAIVVFAIAIGGLLLATPVAVQALVNFVAFGGAITPVIVLALMLAVGLGFAAVLSGLQAWIVEILQRRIFVRMVSDLAHRLPRVNRVTRDRFYGPEMVNRFFDVITVQKMSSLLLLDGLSVMLGVIIGLVVLAFYHPILLAFDLLIIVAVAGIVFLLGRRGVRTAISESRTKYAVAGWFEDIARNPMTFKAPAARDFIMHRSDELARDYVQARKQHYRVLFRQIIGMLFLQVAASVALLGIGGALVIRGELTLGQLVASELIVTYVVGSIAKMGKHFESFYDLMAAVDKLGNLLDLPLERSTGDAWSAVTPSESRGASVRLSDVSFATPFGKSIFQRVSLDIQPGERVSISGSSGLGKSTFVEMLYGTLDPKDGYIEVDGMDVRTVRLEALRDRVAVLNDSEVFEGSILDNVVLGRALSAEQVNDALRAVGLLDVCAGFPDGLRTKMTSKGAPLSGGQIQKLMVARAIVGQPRLLVIDGLLDTMSAASLAPLLDVLTAPSAPWTLILVSNRDEVIDRCDRVIDLPDAVSSERRAV